MKQKIVSLSLVVISLLFPRVSFVFAQTLDATAPTTDTAPVEEMVTPPADTTGPAFISVTTASAQETGATVVWTTDEPAYGSVEYGETISYGFSTPKSASATMDHTVSVTGLASGTTYHYRIIAEDESGNISYSKDRILETALEVVAIDNVPPEITDVSVTNITTSGATISWITDELAQGKIEYGKTAEYDTSSPLATDYATEHSASIISLDPDVEYHYRVVVQDESGNEAVSPDEIFITDAVPVTTPTEEPTTTGSEPTTVTTPETETGTSTTTESADASTPFAISHVETASIGASVAKIIWKTNESATSQIFYSQGETYALSSPLSATNVTSHEIELTNLKSDTNYFYKVVSKNASGKTIEKGGFEFNTLHKQKIIVVAPTISNITVESIGTSTATIVFNTDIPAGGKINYGITTAYEETDGGHNTFLVNHSHPLSGLKPNTVYNFETVVWDSTGNEAIYENVIFTTLPKAVTEGSKPTVVTPAPTPTPGVSFGGSGHYYAPQIIVGKPVLTKVDSLNKEVIFVWQKAKIESGLKTIIVRSENGYVSSPSKGTEIYRGNSGRFADTNLNNNRKYYYSIFRVNETETYSAPLHFTVMPKQDKTQAKIIATPPVVKKTPIYTFSKVLSPGDRNKQVEHLQVILASESSIYPKGLITGYFGPLTEGAVKNFQNQYKLTATGVADRVTLKKLEQISSFEIIKDKAVVYEKTLTRDMELGYTGEDVSMLQQFLVNAEVYPEALVTGYFGPLTKAAVQRFQQEQNIAPTFGYFGPITKKRMLNLIRLRSVSL